VATVVAECVERGVGVHIGDHLIVAQRRALEESAIATGTPPRTTILDGRVISLMDLVEGDKANRGRGAYTIDSRAGRAD
jgi:hypothetical protein